MINILAFIGLMTVIYVAGLFFQFLIKEYGWKNIIKTTITYIIGIPLLVLVGWGMIRFFGLIENIAGLPIYIILLSFIPILWIVMFVKWLFEKYRDHRLLKENTKAT